MALAVIITLIVVSLMSGSYELDGRAVLAALTGHGPELDTTVVLEWRLPRALAAVLLGALLGVAGAVFQTVTHNPLASPDVLGLSNGAFTGMLLVLVLAADGGWPLRTAGALIGGIAAAAVIWLLASRGGVQGFRLIIVGIGVSAVLASINTWLLLQIELETALFASAWGAGSLNGVTAGPLAGAVACAVPLLLVLWLFARPMRQLELGDDAASATGVRPTRVRAVTLAMAVGLVSLSTAVIGPIAFVALAAPQIARRVAGTPSLSLWLSGIYGGALILVSDLVAQHVLPVALPAGVVTVSLGGAYLVVTIVREIRRHV
ncbi:MAG: FecCD family ABC transporter permease [Mycetocola sp.]